MGSSPVTGTPVWASWISSLCKEFSSLCRDSTCSKEEEWDSAEIIKMIPVPLDDCCITVCWAWVKMFSFTTRLSVTPPNQQHGCGSAKKTESSTRTRMFHIGFVFISEKCNFGGIRLSKHAWFSSEKILITFMPRHGLLLSLLHSHKYAPPCTKEPWCAQFTVTQHTNH